MAPVVSQRQQRRARDDGAPRCEIVARVDAHPRVDVAGVVQLDREPNERLVEFPDVDQVAFDARTGHGRAVARADVDDLAIGIDAKLDRQAGGLRPRGVDRERKESEPARRACRGDRRGPRQECVGDGLAIRIEHAQVAEVGARDALVDRVGQRPLQRRAAGVGRDVEAVGEILQRGRRRRRGRLRGGDPGEHDEGGERAGKGAGGRHAFSFCGFAGGKGET